MPSWTAMLLLAIVYAAEAAMGPAQAPLGATTRASIVPAPGPSVGSSERVPLSDTEKVS